MIKTVIAIYPGRFQPFGRHHAESFKWLESKFGKGKTFIATTDVVNLPKSPLSFKEKKQIIDKYGVGSSLVQVKNPYQAQEITQKFDPETTAVVFMVGKKDMQEDPRFKMGTKKDGSPSYFQVYKPGMKMEGYMKHGYLIVAPHTSYDITGFGEMSGTTIRQALSSNTSPEKYKQLFTDIFGWYDPKIADMLKKKFSQSNSVKETVSFEKSLVLEYLVYNLLNEGGKVFKTAKGEEATQRINRADVVPTVKYLEKMTGLKLTDNMLGTTGKKETSGDLDLAVSEDEITKEALVTLLLKKFPQEDIKKSGTNVHVKTPIKGNPKNGFVQTDFMFGDKDFMKFSMQGGAENSEFKGVDRALLMASIAKAQGLKWSYLNGLVDRETNKTITKNPDEIAQKLLGKDATREDLASVEAILDVIKKRKDYKDLIAQAQTDFEKKGLTLNEGLLLEADARIQHPEDLTYWEGSKGASRALATMLSVAKDPSKISVKWDGSPAMIFGVDEKGNFILTDKSGFTAKGYDGKAKSGEELKDMFLNRGKKSGKPMSKDYVNFANNMGGMFDAFKKAFPKGLKGYFKGDLLYQATPPVKDGNFVFKPNITTYTVPTDSEMGKQIAKSKVGIVLHRYIAPDGKEYPIKNISDYKFTTNSGLFVVPPVFIKTPPKVSTSLVSKTKSDISTYAKDIDALLDKSKLSSMKLSNFPDLLYKFTNSKVSDLKSLSSKEFIKFIEKESSLTDAKRNNIIQYCNANAKALDAVFSIAKGIIAIKDDLINQLDSQDLGVKASVGDIAGGEGYVVADPKGDVKLVNRAGFSAANRAVQR
jgi:hypothetical protein